MRACRCKSDAFVTANVLMYSTAMCPYCVRAESYLRAKGHLAAPASV